MSRQQCKAVTKFFQWLQNILRMDDVTKEQRQAARERAWRNNGHTGHYKKASQDQKSDLDEPIRCKIPSKKDNEGEETMLIRLEAVVSHKASQHQESDLYEPVPCKMPPKKDNEGEEMVPEPIPCKMPSKKYDKGEEIVPEPITCKIPSRRYGKGKKMVLVRPKPAASHKREKMFLVRSKPVASPRRKDH